MNRWPVFLLALVLAAGCGDDGKKRASSCDYNADCQGGVCFASECYTACTEQGDCSSNELCVFKEQDDGSTTQICVVAAEHAGCVDDDGCADLVRGRCDAVACDDAGQCVVERGCPGEAPAPVFGAWRALPVEGSPSARNYVVGAWTGSRLCLWGGYDGSSLGDGACYVAADDAWVALPAEGAPSARCLMPQVWAGDRLCTWAGFGAGSSGACWLEAGDAWAPMVEAGAPSTPRQNHGVAWTGSELCFYGGRTQAGGVDLADGGCYDPIAATWRALPAENGPAGATNPSVMWISDRLCVWGGWNASGFAASGACWKPDATAWEPIAAAPEGVLAPFVEARPAGDRLCAWGGSATDGTAYVATGACYHPASGTWHVLPTADAPTARGSNYAAAWTDDWWCLYGGTVADEQPAPGGACYSPALDRWYPMPEAGATPVGPESTAFWTGTEFCAWGGRTNGQNQQSGTCLGVTPAAAE